MCSAGRRLLGLVLAFAFILSVVLTVAPDQYAYAKGTKRDDSSGGSTASERSPRSSDDRQADTSRSSSSSERRSDSDRSSSASERRSDADRPSSEPERRSEPSRSEPSERRSDTPRRSEDIGPIFTPSRSNDTIVRPMPSIRSDALSKNSEVREPRNTDTRGLYRKDYADIGQIWKERFERRDPPRRPSWHRDDDDWRWNIRVDYFPGRYRYYAFDYVPGYVYPSLYCYYYGLYPPYIHGSRIIYVSGRWGLRHVYIDLPIIIIDDGDRYYTNDYYLADWRYRSLSEALRDIRRGWETGNVDLLMDHVRRNSRIDVYLNNEYSYTVDARDYEEMTYDAMKTIRTVSFKFTKVRQRDSREAVAYGEHTYYDDFGYYYGGGIRKTVHVSYTLSRDGNEWYITEVGFGHSRLY